MVKDLKRVIYIIITIIVLLNINIAYVHAVGPMDGSTEKIDSFEGLNGDGKYLGQQYRENYALDMKKLGLLDKGSEIVNDLSNSLFYAEKSLTYLVVTVYYYCYELDLGDLMGDELNAIQERLKGGVFDQLWMVAFAFTAFYLAMQLIKKNSAELFSQIAKVIFILVLSMVFVIKTSSLVTVTSTITKTTATRINNAIVGNGSSTAPTGAQNAGAYWGAMVHKPWLALEFGDPNKYNISDEKISEILSLAPGSDARQSIIDQYNNEHPELFGKDWGGKRLGFILVYFIPLLAKCILMLAVGVIQLFFQIVFILLILLAPVVLLLSFVPQLGGVEIIFHWFKKLLETQLSFIIISIIMSLLTKIDIILYAKANEFGWLIILIIQTILALTLIFKYDTVLKGLTKATKVASQPGFAKQMLHHAQPTETLRQGLNSGVSNVREKLQSLRNGSGNRANRPTEEVSGEEQQERPNLQKTVNLDKENSEESPDSKQQIQRPRLQDSVKTQAEKPLLEEKPNLQVVNGNAESTRPRLQVINGNAESRPKMKMQPMMINSEDNSGQQTQRPRLQDSIKNETSQTQENQERPRLQPITKSSDSSEQQQTQRPRLQDSVNQEERPSLQTIKSNDSSKQPTEKKRPNLQEAVRDKLKTET